MTQTGLSNLQLGYAENLVRQVKGGVQAAVSAMRGFAAPRGRKVMLLLSGGWPYSVSSYTSGGGTPTRELPEGEQLYRRLASTANLLGYTLYPVDVPGVQTGAADVEATGPAAASIGSAEQEVEGSLHYLAKETGGKALLNSNRTLALASAKEDTRSFYWLGFSPSWQRNDKTHDVKLDDAARRPQDPHPHGVPRPLAQGRGDDEGGERAIVRQPSGRLADADEGGHAGALEGGGDGDPAHPRPAGGRDDGAAGRQQVRRPSRAAVRRLGRGGEHRRDPDPAGQPQLRPSARRRANS